jgi:hypothetical protein
MLNVNAKLRSAIGCIGLYSIRHHIGTDNDGDRPFCLWASAKLPNGESEMLIVKMLNGGLRVIMSLLSVGHPEIRFGNF